MKTLLPSLLIGVLSLTSGFAEDAKFLDQEFAKLGITFRVQANGKSVTITPKGLEQDNRPVTHEIEGEITKVEVADLNKDNSPEIYIYIRQPGDEQRGALLAYSANRRKSMSDIYLPEIVDMPEAFAGYTGRDEFSLADGKFVRRFPLPSGKTRQLEYKITSGEAGWRLQLEKVAES
jgi:hypothetical protein